MHFLAERSDATHAEVVLDEAADEEVVEEGEPEHGATTYGGDALRNDEVRHRATSYPDAHAFAVRRTD